MTAKVMGSDLRLVTGLVNSLVTDLGLVNSLVTGLDLLQVRHNRHCLRHPCLHRLHGRQNLHHKVLVKVSDGYLGLVRH